MSIKLPPPLYLLSVLNHCPQAGATYVTLWNNQNSKHLIYAKHSVIQVEYLKSKTKFRQDLICLLKENLISFHECRDPENKKEQMYIIELVSWQDIAGHEDEDYAEC